MKLALVHDWIVQSGGAERTLAHMHRLWPDAPIFTLFYRPSVVRELLPNATVVASGLQKIPFSWRYYPLLAPFMPSAVEALDLSAYDTVVSSSVTYAKGIVVRPETRHICYSYSPTRMLWDRHGSYERRGMASGIFRHALRGWDFSAAQRPDQMIAISQTVANRIHKYYRRSSIVVPPPIRSATPGDASLAPDGEFYLIVARIVAHKALDVVMSAFAKLKYRLLIVGEGPLLMQLAPLASPNITFTGRLTDHQLDGLYERCRAVIVPNEEDWGLTAIEAMSHGKPVLALRRGGSTETVLEGLTGEFYDDPIPEALADGMKRLRYAASAYNPDAIRTHAAQYGEEQFRSRMQHIVASAL